MLHARLIVSLLACVFLSCAAQAQSQSIDGLEVDDEGNVGIGTASPSQALQVTGDVSIGPRGLPDWAEVGVTGRPNARLLLDASTSISAVKMRNSDSNHSFDLQMAYERDGTSIGKVRYTVGSNWGDQIQFMGDHSMHIQAKKASQLDSFGGVEFHTKSLFHESVGVGTRTPNSLVEVNGTLTATSVEETSARRYKTDVEPLKRVRELIEGLRGVRYREHASQEANVGFLAEEVAEVLPELVSMTENGQAKSLNYAHLTAVLVEALEEEVRRKDELKGRVQKQQERLSELEQRAEDLIQSRRK